MINTEIKIKCRMADCDNPDKDEYGLLSINHFPKNKNLKNGYDNRCMWCMKKIQKPIQSGINHNAVNKISALKSYIVWAVTNHNGRAKRYLDNKDFMERHPKYKYYKLDYKQVIAMIIVSDFKDLISNRSLLEGYQISIDHLKSYHNNGCNIPQNILVTHKFFNFGKNHHSLNWAIYSQYRNTGHSKKSACKNVGRIRDLIIIKQAQANLEYEKIKDMSDKEILEYMQLAYSKLTLKIKMSKKQISLKKWENKNTNIPMLSVPA